MTDLSRLLESVTRAREFAGHALPNTLQGVVSWVLAQRGKPAASRGDRRGPLPSLLLEVITLGEALDADARELLLTHGLDISELGPLLWQCAANPEDEGQALLEFLQRLERTIPTLKTSKRIYR